MIALYTFLKRVAYKALTLTPLAFLIYLIARYPMLMHLLLGLLMALALILAMWTIGSVVEEAQEERARLRSRQQGTIGSNWYHW